MRKPWALVLGAIFEADLPPEQYAYHPNRSALDAVRHVHKLLTSGHGQVVDADLSGYFDSIPHPTCLNAPGTNSTGTVPRDSYAARRVRIFMTAYLPEWLVAR